jgi:hypothetical protein
MTTTAACESCGMPIETGRYCGYCTDETGALQSFDERFERTWPPCPPGGTTRALPPAAPDPTSQPTRGATRPLM